MSRQPLGWYVRRLRRMSQCRKKLRPEVDIAVGFRPDAIARMQRALDFFVIEGIRTSIPLHREILRDPVFRSGRFSTRYLEGFTARREAASRDA